MSYSGRYWKICITHNSRPSGQIELGFFLAQKTRGNLAWTGGLDPSISSLRAGNSKNTVFSAPKPCHSLFSEMAGPIFKQIGEHRGLPPKNGASGTRAATGPSFLRYCRITVILDIPLEGAPKSLRVGISRHVTAHSKVCSKPEGGKKTRSSNSYSNPYYLGPEDHQFYRF